MRSKDHLLKIFFLLLSLAILFACSTMTIEKRKHSRGYFIHFNKKSGNLDQTDQEQQKEIDKAQRNDSKWADENSSVSLVQQHSTKDTIEFPLAITEYKKEISDENKLSESAQGNSIVEASNAVVISSGNKVRGKEEKGNITRVLLSLILIFPFFIAFKGVNPKWVKWTREHPVKARWFLIASSIIAFVVATLIGSILRFPFSPAIAIIGVFGLILSVISYFSFNRSESDLIRRGGKYFGITMFRASALFMTFGIGGSNVTLNTERLRQWDFLSGALSLPQDEVGYYYSDGEIAGFVVLGIVVLLGILYLTAVWSCNLSCSGNDLAAAVVLAGGTFLAVFLSFLIFFNAFKKKDTEVNEITKKALITGLIAMLILGVFVLIT